MQATTQVTIAMVMKAFMFFLSSWDWEMAVAGLTARDRLAVTGLRTRSGLGTEPPPALSLLTAAARPGRGRGLLPASLTSSKGEFGSGFLLLERTRGSTTTGAACLPDKPVDAPRGGTVR